MELEERSYQNGLEIGALAKELSGYAKVVATILHGRALSGVAQFDAAQERYADALLHLQPVDARHSAYMSVLSAENALSAGWTGPARDSASLVLSSYAAHNDYFLRQRASRVVVECALASGDQEAAVRLADEAMKHLLENRLIRRKTVLANPAALVREIFGRYGSAFLHLVRTDMLQRGIRDRDDEEWEPEPIALAMAMSRSSDDLVELLLSEARKALLKGRPGVAKPLTCRALMELDGTRYLLAAQSARTSWSRRFQRALAAALDAAYTDGDTLLIAELLEFARVQTLPAASAEQSDQLALSTPPVVTIRGLSRLGQPGLAGRPPPVPLERAAARAAGKGAWWLSYWQGDQWLYWSLVPTDGPTISGGRIDCSPGSELSRALRELQQALPLLLPGEEPGAADFRLAASPLLCNPTAEYRLSWRLGHLLLPRQLIDAAADVRSAGGGRLPLAIAPAALLGYVPWSLLVSSTEVGDSPRLVNMCDWVLAPSAALLAHAPTVPLGPAPLALVVADTINTQALPELTGARTQASDLNRLVTVLGGRHWSSQVATLDSIEEQFSRLRNPATVAFFCHAIRGTPQEPSTGGLVLAAGCRHDVKGDRPDRNDYTVLSPPRIFDMTNRGIPMPAQVLLQACDTSALSDAASGEWLTIAPALVAGGSREVVATLYPLPDWPDPDDPLISAAIAGGSLREAVGLVQRRGLVRWSTDNTTNPAQTPLAWAAFATVAVDTAHLEPEFASSTPLISEQLVRILEYSIKLCREARAQRLDSGYILSAVLEDTEIAELFDGGSSELKPAAFIWTLGPYVCSRFLRVRDGDCQWIEGRSGARIRVSTVVIDAVDSAARVAMRDGVPCQPVHVLEATLQFRSAAHRILRMLSALSRRDARLTTRALEHELADRVSRGVPVASEDDTGASEDRQLARALISYSLRKPK